MLLRPLAILTALILGSLFASWAHGVEGSGPRDTESLIPAAPVRTAEREGDLAAQLAAATGRVAAEEYFLTYKFHTDDVMRTRVSHRVTVETSIQGNTQTAQSSSSSVKRWTITNVAENGDITLELTVEHIDMWQEVSGRERVSYDSRTDERPPLDYEEAASTVGEVLATVTINHHGRVVQRENADGEENLEREAELGFGDLAVPLPEGNVKVGDQWFLPLSYRVRLPSQQYQLIQMRHRYQLEAVEGNIAVISLHTERLTPVSDPTVESQLMQQMQHGEIRFDIEAGRLISKELDLNEMVIGFQGANSRMKYIGAYRERAIEQAPADAQATAPAEDTQAAAPTEPTERVAEAPASDDDGSGAAAGSYQPNRQRRLFRR